ncbi:MAG: dephospho-CoA kinase [Lachnospiraceae bacterium]|nr:dephospho-CoA kinase [Lachnospiraceae bacterium]
MYTIGATGGMGAGKSEVLNYLKESRGAGLLPLDDVTRKMTEPGGVGFSFYVHEFGRGILLTNGTLDKTAIAARLFEDPAEKEKIDAFFRPMVQKAVKKAQNASKNAGKKLFVIESAILLEEHYDAFCDELWYIYADEATRRGRLKAARGYSDERIDRTFQRQLPDREFRARCDFVVDNSGSFEATKRAIDVRLDEILGEGVSRS